MFSATNDRQITEGGGFWCHACLDDKPVIEQSPDPRYCHSCFDLLLQEAELLGHSKRPSWTPGALQDPVNKNIESQNTGEKSAHVSQDVGIILSTVNGNNSEVDKIKSRMAKTPRRNKAETRGRKQIELPLDYVERLAKEGMGSKRITAQLKVEHDIYCSYRTVARVLKGERN